MQTDSPQEILPDPIDSLNRLKQYRHIPEIEHIAGVGWLLDLAVTAPGSREQLELAPGYQLPRTSAEFQSEGEGVSFAVENEKLILDVRTGQISIFTGEILVLRSAPDPFSVAAEPIHQGIIRSKTFETLLKMKPPLWVKNLEPDERFETMKVSFRFERPSGPILGLPGSTGEFDRGGYRFELYNTDNGNHDPGRKPLYQSWPVLFMPALRGDGWLAVFWDNPSRTFVDCGDFEPGIISFESCWGHGRALIVAAPTLREVCTKLNTFLGSSIFPPAWAFGYQQCRWSYMSTDEGRDVVEKFRSQDIPLDVLYWDIDYMNKFQVFTSNPEGFVDFPDCVAELRRSGVMSVAIVDPGIQIDEEYSVYRELRDSHRYLLEGDGSPMEALVWPGKSLLPDFTDEKTSQWWSETQRRWLADTGVAGVWNDMNEPANWNGGNKRTSQAVCSRGPWAPDYNLYGYLMAEASSRGHIPGGDRPLVITRSGYPGVHQFSIIWHGDNHSWWEHLSLAVKTAITYSLSGAIFTGPDVPGFMQNAPEDLAVRFFQLGAFMPFFRGHSAIFDDPKEPFRYRGEAQLYIVDAIKLRYSLLREWYSGIERCRRMRVPAMEPVFRDKQLALDQFLLFDKFLVAPVMQRAQFDRAIYFPPGLWYRLGDEKVSIDGGRTHLFPVTLDSIPVFVREGTILTRNEVRRNAVDTLTAPERWEIYPDESGNARGYWYDDVGGNGVFHRVMEVKDGAIEWRDLDISDQPKVTSNYHSEN